MSFDKKPGYIKPENRFPHRLKNISAFIKLIQIEIYTQFPKEFLAQDFKDRQKTIVKTIVERLKKRIRLVSGFIYQNILKSAKIWKVDKKQMVLCGAL